MQQTPIRAVLLTAAWMQLAMPASGQSPQGPFDLEWQAPKGCPTASDVREDVNRLLGPSGDAPRDYRAFVRAQIVRHGEGHELRLQVTAGKGARVEGGSDARFRAQSCKTLAKLTAVYAALAVDPFVVADLDTEDVEPVVAPEAPAATPAAAKKKPLEIPASAAKQRPTPPPRRQRSEPMLFGASAGGAAQVGLVPSVGPGLGFEVWTRTHGVRFEVVLLHWLGRFEASEVAETEGVDVQLTTGGLRGCASLSGSGAAPTQLWFCGGAHAGVMVGQGVGVADARRQADPWAAVAIGPLAEWRPDPGLDISLAGRLEAMVPVARPAFEIENLGEIYRAPQIGGLGSISAQVHFR